MGPGSALAVLACPGRRRREHVSAISRRDFARVMQILISSPSNQRAQGMPGARCTRGLVCQIVHYRRTRAYRAAEAVRHPLRNGFTAYFVLSPVERACCHRRRQHTCCQLSASIAAPGPHDLAVRLGVFVRRQKTPDAKASTASRAPRVVTIMIRPSCGRETGGVIILIFGIAKRNIFVFGA